MNKWDVLGLTHTHVGGWVLPVPVLLMGWVVGGWVLPVLVLLVGWVGLASGLGGWVPVLLVGWVVGGWVLQVPVLLV